MVNPFARGELSKMSIKAFDDKAYTQAAALPEFSVYINPSEYTLNFEAEYQNEQAPGTTGNEVVFKRIKPRELALNFLLDGMGTTGVKINVQEKLDEFFKVCGYNGNIHRPHFLLINWGNLEVRCVLKSASVTYKLFTSKGEPLRVSISANFTENIDDALRVAEADDRSPDLTHVRTVKEGDTLPMMAYHIYGDPRYYLQVARVNGLDRFTDLQPGQRLFFPPLEKN